MPHFSLQPPCEPDFFTQLFLGWMVDVDGVLLLGSVATRWINCQKLKSSRFVVVPPAQTTPPLPLIINSLNRGGNWTSRRRRRKNFCLKESSSREIRSTVLHRLKRAYSHGLNWKEEGWKRRVWEEIFLLQKKAPRTRAQPSEAIHYCALWCDVCRVEPIFFTPFSTELFISLLFTFYSAFLPAGWQFFSLLFVRRLCEFSYFSVKFGAADKSYFCKL